MFFADSRALTKFFDESWYLFAGLIAVVSLSVWLVIWLRAQLHDDTDRPTNPDEMLKQFEDSLLEGELTEEEYRSIKGRLLSQDQSTPTQVVEEGLQSKRDDSEDLTDEEESTELTDDQKQQD